MTNITCDACGLTVSAFGTTVKIGNRSANDLCAECSEKLKRVLEQMLWKKEAA